MEYDITESLRKIIQDVTGEYLIKFEGMRNDRYTFTREFLDYTKVFEFGVKPRKYLKHGIRISHKVHWEHAEDCFKLAESIMNIDRRLLDKEIFLQKNFTGISECSICDKIKFDEG